MNDFIKKYNKIWGDNPSQLLDEYDYHIELTDELDNINPNKLDYETFYKMILWKLSRFPYISESLLHELKNVSNIKPKQHEKSRDILKELLKTSGIALPMASTILRFLNPQSFQIIDDRAYRVLLSDNPKYPSKPSKITEGYLEKSIDIYFNYLDKIHQISSRQLPFEDADRILYILDKKLGNKLGDKI